MQPEEYINEHEAAKTLGKSVSTIRNWRSRHQNYGPRFFKIGANVRYRRSDIHAWLEGCAVEPAARNEERAA